MRVDLVICAESGEGVEGLLPSIASRLVPNEPPPAQCIPVSQHHANLIRRVVDLLDAGDTQRANDILASEQLG